jgi:hypothetical protein
MNIQLLKTTDDQRKAFKNCTNVGSVINAVPTDDMSELQPKIVINYDSAYLNANYVYIALFDKYYTIDKKAVTIGKKIILECTIDAVMSFYYDILNCNITAVRNGGLGQPTKIQDTKFPVLPNEQELMQTVATNSALKNNNEWCYVITVIGGTANGS